MTLGQTIGKVSHVFDVTNSSDVKVRLSVTFDFTTASDADIKSWLVSNRVIAFQRPTRTLSASEIHELDGTTIVAQHAGQKVKSRAERIQDIVNAGIPESIAIKMADGEIPPDKMAAIEAIINE